MGTKNTSLPMPKDRDNDEEEEEDREDVEQEESDDINEEDLTDEMVVSGDPEIVKVTITSKTSSQPRRCEMQELTASKRGFYMDKLKQHFERDGTTVKQFRGIQTSLLADCIFDTEDVTDPEPKFNGKEGKAVPRAYVEDLPTKATDRLYIRAAYMNGLDEKAAVRAKKHLRKTLS